MREISLVSTWKKEVGYNFNMRARTHEHTDWSVNLQHTFCQAGCPGPDFPAGLAGSSAHSPFWF